MKFIDKNNGQQFTLNQKLKRVFVKIGICLIVFGIGYWFIEFSTEIQNSAVIVGDDHHKLLSPEVADLTLFDQFPVNNTRMYEGIIPITYTVTCIIKIELGSYIFRAHFLCLNSIKMRLLLFLLSWVGFG